MKIKKGLSFDDVLLLPKFSNVRKDETNLSTSLTAKIKINIPLVSSPMDSVTEADLAIALAKTGGLGIIHRNLGVASQADQVRKVKKENLLVGAAVGIGDDLNSRVKALIKAKVDCLVIDSAHGEARYIIELTKKIHHQHPDIPLISGNVGTPQGFENLAKAGAEAIRVGLGPASICTTRIIAGVGIPQLTAIIQCSKISKKYKTKLIADGGIRYSGDITKALAAGADTVMLGSLFAQTKEAAGKLIKIKGKKYKYYRGMGSIAAMKKGSAARYDQNHQLDEKKLIAEGVEGLVPFRGKVSDLVFQLMGGLKSGMAYVGARNLKELQEKAEFIRLTPASLKESHPHNILITESGANYY